jgi:hypothetical protein
MKRLARTLGFLTAAAMALTQAPVGFVRDEGYYFTAARSYEEWLQLLLHAPLQALGQTERYWSYNFEHPGLTKLLFAASHLVFSTWLKLLPDALAWRLPAFAFAGLLSYWLCILGSRRSRAAGVLAPLLFWCAERTFFHGHLACFDIPICALWAGVGVAWLRAIDEKAGGRRLEAGGRFAFVYGVSLAVKHNAWFLPPVLLVHALLLRGEDRKRALRTLPWLLLSPLVLFAAWPLLWRDPIRHLGDWIAFHSHHVHYAWRYFGQVLRGPPFPVVYPLVIDALALPLPLVALLAAAGAKLLADFARRRLDAQRLLELGLAGAALLPFVLRTTPIFGGLKHWLAFVALLTPEAAALLVRAAEQAPWPRSRALALGAAPRVVADRSRAPVRHQRLWRAGGRHPRRGVAGHAAAVLVQQRHLRPALAQRALPTRRAGLFSRGECREL